MNPIPLASPDGKTYAYACGVCHNVKAGAFALGPWPADEPHENLTERSRVDAERCCVCSTCGARPVAFLGCDDCNRDRSANWMWWAIGTCMQRGFTTRAQLDAHIDSDD